eukprot:gene32462-31074_t
MAGRCVEAKGAGLRPPCVTHATASDQEQLCCPSLNWHASSAGLGTGVADDEAGMAPGVSDDEAGMAPCVAEDEASMAPGVSDDEAGMAPGVSDDEAGMAPSVADDEAGMAQGVADDEAGMEEGVADDEAGIAPGVDDDEAGMVQGVADDEAGMAADFVHIKGTGVAALRGSSSGQSLGMYPHARMLAYAMNPELRFCVGCAWANTLSGTCPPQK